MRNDRFRWGRSRPAQRFLLPLGEKAMTLREILLVLWVLAVMVVKFLVTQFAAHAQLALEDCFALGLASFGALAQFLLGL